MTARMGVIADPAEDFVVREFFELFKIPWEYYRNDQQYEVVLCAGAATLDYVATRLLIVYAGEKTSFDDNKQIPVQSRQQGSPISYAGSRLPIFGSSITFRQESTAEADPHPSFIYMDRFGEQVFARVGYDLFREVRALLTEGQDPANGAIPTLDLHIALLRDLVLGCGIPLVEIPPVPDRYSFIACLTHDVDHASIRRHKFDRTMFGFLYRAILGSAVNLLRGRVSMTKLWMNWSAAAKLPLVYLGLAKDFWNEFERYLEIERGQPSTFFVIPFAGRAGHTLQGSAPLLRATRYDLSDIAAKIPVLMSAGCEIGVHGIDAWMDSSRGREEAGRISELSGKSQIGVRMHWLYMNADSPALLDDAGFLYDSTVGYSETVGYRAGTSQVFKPLPAKRILELPLHIMDTALFYPGRMDLSPREAWEKVAPILDNTARYGGVLTINWHDRSIAPERLWEDFYIRLLDCLENQRPWFSTAAQAVCWFRRRRSVTFDSAEGEQDSMRVKANVPRDETLPAMRLRVHQAREPAKLGDFSFNNNYGYRDVCLNSDIDICIPFN